MTETKEKAVSRGEYSEGISIETSKVIQGMSLVFSGAMTMLEAIHPKISVEPAELMCLMTGDREGLIRLAEMRKAEETAKPMPDAADTTNEEDADEPKKPDAGTVDVPADDPDAAVSDPHGDDDSADGVTQEPSEPSEPVTTLTQDDITRVIVQKIKQNRSNNEKIGQLLKAHGVSKVSELPPAKYEAFLTDLSAI